MNGWASIYETHGVTDYDGPGTLIQYQRPSSGCLGYLLYDGGEAAIVDPLRVHRPLPRRRRGTRRRADVRLRHTRARRPHLRAPQSRRRRRRRGDAPGRRRRPRRHLRRRCHARRRGRRRVHRGRRDRRDRVHARTHDRDDIPACSTTASRRAMDCSSKASPAPPSKRATTRPGSGSHALRLAADPCALARRQRARRRRTATRRPNRRRTAPTPPIGELRERMDALSADEDEFVETVLADMPPPRPTTRTSSRRTSAERRRRRRGVHLELGPNNCAASQDALTSDD